MPSDSERYRNVPPEKRWWDKPSTCVLYAKGGGFIADCTECSWLSEVSSSFEYLELLGERHLTEAHGWSLVKMAEILATRAHSGQVDKVGEPYIEHPRRVAEALRAEGFDEEVQAVGWLHDVIEDTSVTLDDLRSWGFSTRVIAAVDAITKRRGESFADYYERVKGNPMALAAKWFDVADNARPDRLAKVAPDTRDRLRDKYERARRILGAER